MILDIQLMLDLVWTNLLGGFFLCWNLSTRRLAGWWRKSVLVKASSSFLRLLVVLEMLELTTNLSGPTRSQRETMLVLVG